MKYERPPLGKRPTWIGIEHWMDDHPYIGWIAIPIHAIAMTLWRRRNKKRWKR